MSKHFVDSIKIVYFNVMKGEIKPQTFKFIIQINMNQPY